jgi:predicted nucleic acid-binding protein
MSDLLFDTCFLIDIERELRRGGGPAHRFLKEQADDHPWISWTVVGEFAEGFGGISDPACRAVLNLYEVVEMNDETADQYAKITSSLRKSSQLIGANDLWIAAAALATGFPLVTNNTKHFGRIPGLKVMGY